LGFSVEFFKNPNIDFLGKKWYFLAFSLVFSVAGVISLIVHRGPDWGIDFRGGTLVYVKYTHKPSLDTLRSQLDRAGIGNARLQTLGSADSNEVLVDLPQEATSESELETPRNRVVDALTANKPAGKVDLNNSSVLAITKNLLDNDPLHYGIDAPQKYGEVAQAIANFRDKTKGGVLSSFSDLNGVADPAVVTSLQSGFFLSDFGVYQDEIVGPQVGAQLRKQALLATMYSLAGMLIYLAIRFEWIYGVAAVITVFHDTLITVGAFSLTRKPISLTVIAAILTLIGYSNNDTIVVFDRIRENLKMMRREKLSDIVNRSINQTLSRTILTAGLTFLTVLALFLFGGEVLHGFSFALVIGILIGTYSSIAIAAPILVAYQDWRASQGRPGQAGMGRAPGGSGKPEKAKTRA
jgi:preprotein translocase subunit SecF